MNCVSALGSIWCVTVVFGSALQKLSQKGLSRNKEECLKVVWQIP